MCGKEIHETVIAHVNVATLDVDGKQVEVILKTFTSRNPLCRNECDMVRLLQSKKLSHVMMPIYANWVDMYGVPRLCTAKAPIDMFDYYQQLRKDKKVAQEVISRKLAWHTRCILKLLIDLHTNHISHGDLKPENIVCKDSDEAKELAFIDFADSSENDPDAKYHLNCGKNHIHDGRPIGTISYQYPLTGFKQESNLFKHDLWAVAMIVLCLFSGFSFINDSSQRNTVRYWQTSFINGSWVQHLDYHRPDLQADPLYKDVVDFVSTLIGMCAPQGPPKAASLELLKLDFVRIDRFD